jgi:hypothetical protein
VNVLWWVRFVRRYKIKRTIRKRQHHERVLPSMLFAYAVKKSSHVSPA